MGRVLVAMSGGVDSSVAAALMKREGHEVLGLFMRNGVEAGPRAQSSKQGCCSLEDSRDARLVAAHLGAKFYVLNLADDFQRVIDYFVGEYRKGRTPNPCAVCNTDLKFGRLLDYAKAVGAERIVTGHYARTDRRGDRWSLLRGVDETKDQSYYLFGLTQEQLAVAHFPLGGLRKSEVRAMAAELALKTRDKPESMEICFVPEGDYRKVVRERAPEAFRPGSTIDTSGRVLGSHQGVAGFTVGQRRGLGVSSSRPLYVIRLDAETNTVVVGDEGELSLEEMTVDRVNWIVEPPSVGTTLPAVVKVRYRHAGALAEIEALSSGRVRVRFLEPVRGITPGQCAVFYERGEDGEAGEVVLGGGWIE